MDRGFQRILVMQHILTKLHLIKNTFMFTLTKLPRFMEYLYSHYHRYYDLYNGRLIELFPCFQSTEASLAIAEDEESSHEEDEALYDLWKKFESE